MAQEHLELTARLYNGDRLAQELILGVGGVRMLRALEMDVRLYHFNEGHALFAGFELLREEMAKGLCSRTLGRLSKIAWCLPHIPRLSQETRHTVSKTCSMQVQVLMGHLMRPP